jgi:hypothetical protein
MIRPITAGFGERATLLAGSLSGAAGFFIYGVAPGGLIFCLGIPIMAFWGLAALATVLMSRVRLSEQGTAADRDATGAFRVARSDALHGSVCLLHWSRRSRASTRCAISLGLAPAHQRRRNRLAYD